VCYRESESYETEVNEMPNLWRLIEELQRLDVDPGEIRLPVALYDDFLDQGSDIAEKTQVDTADEIN
jgi:hypothetical protein